MSPLSTAQVAKRLGIARSTLELWIQQGRVKPRTLAIGKKVYRIWTGQEIGRVHRVKEKTYRKGRGRKKKKA